MDDLQAARRYARAYARWRCGGRLPLYKGCPPGQTGRGKLDPVYVEETEGRDVKQFWAHYSSCGDLSQGFVWHMGVRTPYVNRKAHEGWRPGRNLIDFYDARPDTTTRPRLADYVREHGRPAMVPPAGYVPAAGDIGFIWTPGMNNAHTFVFGDALTNDVGKGALVETFNYGAGGMTRTEWPGAHCSESLVTQRNGALWLGQRKLQYIVPLERVIADSSALPAMSGEVIDELEGRVP